MPRTPDFDALYRADPDPWRVRSSFYEARHLAMVLACLGSPRYASAWDPASGTGELAARLAERCDRVLASDASPEAARLTGKRCSALPTVEVRQLVLPAPPPAAWTGLELVVLSEFSYYLDADARRSTLDLVHARCAAYAEVLSVHWRHEPADAWLSGAAVQHETCDRLGALGWRATVHHEDVDFVLDVLRREPG